LASIRPAAGGFAVQARNGKKAQLIHIQAINSSPIRLFGRWLLFINLQINLHCINHAGYAAMTLQRFQQDYFITDSDFLLVARQIKR
jgi:hypothetical protein